MPNRRPVGVFDSGLGGLTVVREIRRLLPKEDMIFLADQANLPYGEKSEAKILELTGAAVPTMIAEGAKLIVIACNSASVSIIERLRERYPGTPFVAVVPMIKPAAERTKTGTIAVFATKTTLGSLLYADLKRETASQVNVIDIPCPKWASMVESGKFSEKVVAEAVEEALAAGADQLILGCTHYPFLTELITPLAAGKAEVLESAPAIARQVKRILIANDALAKGTGGKNIYLTSGDPKKASRVASKLLGTPITFQSVGR